MDQQKIGAFLKILRKQHELTQEQFAEIVNVSNRTVSRWENGKNMPDLDILIQISDYYEIELRELLDGERKSEQMDKELEATVLKAADYTSAEMERYTKRVRWLFLMGAILWFVSQIIQHTKLAEMDTMSAGFVQGFAQGGMCGLFIAGLVITSRYGQRIQAFKQRILKR